MLALTIHHLRVWHALVCDELPSQARLSEHIIFVWMCLMGQTPKKASSNDTGLYRHTVYRFKLQRLEVCRNRVQNQLARDATLATVAIHQICLRRFQLAWKISVSGFDYPKQRLNIRYQISETNTSICYYSWLASSATYRACSASSSSRVTCFLGNINLYT